jgi:hypothetical protein
VTKRNPFEKTYHMAAKVNDKGDVSALCYTKPRAIDLRKQSWTVRPDAVTCPRCRRVLNQQKPDPIATAISQSGVTG